VVIGAVLPDGERREASVDGEAIVLTVSIKAS
jgi:hypothetical protein